MSVNGALELTRDAGEMPAPKPKVGSVDMLRLRFARRDWGAEGESPPVLSDEGGK